MGKQIVKYIEDGEWVDGEVDGEVVDEVPPNSAWNNVWSFFFSHGATVGGDEWEEKHKRKPYNDNGRECDPASGNWEYTEAAGGDVNPSQCDYPQDYQGSIPCWDGYSGE